MTELKTKPTMISVKDFIDGIEDTQQRQDSKRLLSMMKRATGENPKLWGSKIVGFGEYHYKYASGREGDWFRIGFAPRKKQMTLYVMSGFVGFEALLSQLGKHSLGKGCLYLKNLDSVDEKVLVELMEQSLAHLEATERVVGGVPGMSEMPLPKKA
ncbi:MAG: DUF1801 domain-containing protein [Acidimicrobiia bacterium]